MAKNRGRSRKFQCWYGKLRNKAQTIDKIEGGKALMRTLDIVKITIKANLALAGGAGVGFRFSNRYQRLCRLTLRIRLHHSSYIQASRSVSTERLVGRRRSFRISGIAR